VDVFRNRGVTNVAFAWVMMSWTFDPDSGRDPSAYYPGDGYVDIIGSDGYNWYPGWPDAPWDSFRTVFAPTNDFAVVHNKPWMAVEVGCQEDPDVPGRKGKWFKRVPGVADDWPRMKAFIYFDIIKDFAPDSWQSDTSASSKSGYAKLANDAYFTP
jgi:beta-mannanase